MEPDAGVVYALFETLERGAPGSVASTLRALEAIPNPRGLRRVLDLGAGPGASALALAEALPSARVLALDLHAPFLRRLLARAQASARLSGVAALVADMGAPPFADRSFDLLWAEGSIYNVGVASALDHWRRLLTARGCLAFSDAVLLSEPVAHEVAAFWAREYPAILTVGASLKRIEASGYEALGHFVLPESDWRAYYEPLAARLLECERERGDDPQALAVLSAFREEIDLYARFRGSYGYGFFVTRPC